MPGGITRRFAPRPAGRPGGRSPPLRGVVEPSCFLSAVRINASGHGLPMTVSKKIVKLAPRDGTEINENTSTTSAISRVFLHRYPQKHPEMQRQSVWCSCAGWKSKRNKQGAVDFAQFVASEFADVIRQAGFLQAH
jgi:hypothetical protein